MASSVRYLAVAAALTLWAPAAFAHESSSGGDEDIPPPPPTYQANGVTVEEHVGAKLPLDTPFRTQDGKPVRLGDVVAGGLPVILTFNYSDCPMLCSVQLNGLTAALPVVGKADSNTVFRVGAQYKIVTIDLEPNETLEKVSAMREKYLARLPEDQRALARDGWTFLIAAMPGDGSGIARVAEAVGFKYTYIKDRAEWAHPAALIFVSAGAAVTRYVYGVEFEPALLRESLTRAGLAEVSAAAGFMIRCYHYDPDANSHAHAGVMALRIGAAGFVVLLLSALGVMHLVRRKRMGVS